MFTKCIITEALYINVGSIMFRLTCILIIHFQMTDNLIKYGLQLLRLVRWNLLIVEILTLYCVFIGGFTVEKLYLLVIFTASRHYDPDACCSAIFSRSTSCSHWDKGKICGLFSGTCKIFRIYSCAAKHCHSNTQMSPGHLLLTWHFLPHFKATHGNKICKLVTICVLSVF